MKITREIIVIATLVVLALALLAALYEGFWFVVSIVATAILLVALLVVL